MADAPTTIFINGTEYPFKPGQTVIQVAQENGIDVPHYCYHPGLTIAGNCRICMVEVEGNPKPQISCKMECAPPPWISEPLRIQTDSDVAQQGREGTMEMLLVNHPLDCPICDQAGECHLQDYSYEVGQGKASTTTSKTKLPKNVAFGSKIVYDAERCIKCTLCVRFCEEVTDTHELAMQGRSDHEMVVMTSKGEFTTPYSMNIIDLCPVGALTSRDFRFKSRLWFMDFAESVCTGCARGCNVMTGGRNGTFLRMEPRENQAVNKWWMCDAGRTDYQFVNSDSRLEAPLVRGDDGEFRVANWEDAITAAAAALKASPGDVLVDGGCSLEEMALAADLAAAMGGKAKYAAAHGSGDDFLVVAEKGANAAGAELLGLARAQRASAASILVIERDEHVNASFRDKSGAVVVFAADGEHVPDSAQVVFPIGTWGERDGLLVNCDGIVQAVQRNAAIGPNNLAAPIELFEDVLGELDDGYDWSGRDGVIASIRALPGFSNIEFPAGIETAGVGAR
jgi:NADH-quinone oxidoreductase subunit G